MKDPFHTNVNIKAGDCRAFINQLSLSIRGKIFVVWDNLRCHKSKKVYDYLDSQHRISCFYFPPYAPELNPVEYVWSYLKSSPLSNFAPKNFDELSEKSKSAFHHLKYKHRLLTSLVKHSPIPFFD
ncbi:MAG: transposase [Deltaproteobacteria bacterium CG_4_10_14_0_2_um_filter_43_8]|nr:MAG: transposase [Deltaproteobacteria bacterium CG11_big_fil_rev_8_21_14_0_20_49_13]PJA19718.1 MAG: transposase [Deltaproteobacteria bacterium CG_4_10_14_0_2_um_filter_43_8]